MNFKQEFQKFRSNLRNPKFVGNGMLILSFIFSFLSYFPSWGTYSIFVNTNQIFDVFYNLGGRSVCQRNGSCDIDVNFVCPEGRICPSCSAQNVFTILTIIVFQLCCVCSFATWTKTRFRHTSLSMLALVGALVLAPTACNTWLNGCRSQMTVLS
eukprot:32764_1